MGRRSVLVVLGAAAVAAAVARRRAGAPSGAHVDVFYVDGSMVSLGRDEPRAARMLAVAGAAIAAARAA